MSTSTPSTTEPGVGGPAEPPLAAQPLLRSLFDDAALYPPGNAPMPRAVREHATHRAGWYAPYVGPFLCPAGRLDELLGELPAEPAAGWSGQPLRIALLADAGGPDGLQAAVAVAGADPRVEVVHVEAPLAADTDPDAAVRRLVSATPACRLFVEVPRGARSSAALGAVARAARHTSRSPGHPDIAGKYRTGGVDPGAVPSPDELAAVLRAAVDLDLSLKLTAGLHHAVRVADPASGVVQHGFLNVLMAVRAALLGAETDELAGVLAECDPEPLLEQVHRMSEPDAMVVRSFFVSFGCCGVTDPVGDLVALGLIRAR
jgi:hypothetical protein